MEVTHLYFRILRGWLMASQSIFFFSFNFKENVYLFCCPLLLGVVLFMVRWCSDVCWVCVCVRRCACGSSYFQAGWLQVIQLFCYYFYTFNQYTSFSLQIEFTLYEIYLIPVQLRIAYTLSPTGNEPFLCLATTQLVPGSLKCSFSEACLYTLRKLKSCTENPVCEDRDSTPHGPSSS